MQKDEMRALFWKITGSALVLGATGFCSALYAEVREIRQSTVEQGSEIAVLKSVVLRLERLESKVDETREAILRLEAKR